MKILRLHLLPVFALALLAFAGCESPEVCSPTTCEAAGKNCGELDDGCGGTLTCGSCRGGLTCGGGGTANVCGAPACVPTTCEAAGRNCGELDDGCGAKLACGTCTGLDSCGGGGTVGVCGLNCGGMCPPSYACGDGLCSDGDPEALLLNGRAVTISGRVLHNGATPKVLPACGANEDALKLTLRDEARGYTLTHDIPCGTTDFSFSMTAYPGLYRVSVANEGFGSAGYNTDLPPSSASVVVAEALEVDGDVADLAFDVKSFALKGKVTHNGAQPQKTADCTDGRSAATVTLGSGTGFSSDIQIGLPCATTDFSFETRVYPGTWNVEVRNGTASGRYFSDLPPTSEDYAAFAPLVVSADVSGLVLDVKSYLVKGSVTLDGAPPQLTAECTAGRTAATVAFRKGTGFSSGVQVALPCATTDFTFETRLFPGTWAVGVENERSTAGYHTNLPETQQAFAFAPLDVNADVTGLALDVKSMVQVSGTVTHNGVAPVLTATCTGTRNALRLSFEDEARGYDFVHSIPCSTTDFAFDVKLFPGSYAVSVENVGSGSSYNTDLPGTFQGYLAIEKLEVTGPQTGVAVDAKSITVGGKVLLEGATPAITASCTGSRNAARVSFRLPGGGSSNQLDIPCSTTDFSYGGRVYQGTYEVAVSNVQSFEGYNSTLPATSASQIIHQALQLTGDRSDLDLDVKSSGPSVGTVTVAGKITLRGELPSTTQRCTASNSSSRVRFTNTETEEETTVSIPCTEVGFAFSATVKPGTWDVSVQNNGSSEFNSNLPPSSAWFVVKRSLELKTNVDQLVLDVVPVRVAGTVLYNGAKPELTAACVDDRAAIEVRFRDVNASELSLSAFTFPVLCSSEELAFQGEVYPGEYRVTLKNVNHFQSPRGYATNLPASSEELVAIGRLQVP